MSGRTARAALAAALPILLGLAPTAAFAHGEDEHEEPPVEEAPMAEPGHRAMPVDLHLNVPEEVVLGEKVRLEATLTDADGEPIPDVPVTFLMPMAWGEEIAGEAVLGTALTDHEGVATLTTDMRRSGPASVIARFEGDAGYRPASETMEMTIVGDRQLYTPQVGLRVPGVGSWLLIAVVAGVWFLFLVVSGRILAIARAGRAIAVAESPAGGLRRREFLARLAVVPLGMSAAVAGIGTGLVGLILRSPRTHENLHLPPHRPDYGRTPYAWVGKRTPVREMPAILERPVSFSEEVFPILLLKGGPHSAPPRNQEPPHGIRLDSYEHIMEMEGLVVPGKPEESDLVTVLLDPAMQMPPSSLGLPDPEIQLIASWVAQGAQDN